MSSWWNQEYRSYVLLVKILSPPTAKGDAKKETREVAGISVRKIIAQVVQRYGL